MIKTFNHLWVEANRTFCLETKLTQAKTSAAAALEPMVVLLNLTHLALCFPLLLPSIHFSHFLLNSSLVVYLRANAKSALKALLKVQSCTIS